MKPRAKATDAERLWKAVRGVEAGSLESLEQLLLEADFGVPVTMRLVEEVERLAKRGDVKTRDQFQEALRQGLAALRGRE